MRRGRLSGAPDLAREAACAGEVGWRVRAARPSVAEAHRAGHGRSDANGEHERRPAREAAVKVVHAPARGARVVLLQDAPAQRRPAGADALGHGAVHVVAPDVIRAPERSEQPFSAGRYMCRCDSDDRASGHDEDHREIGEPGNGASRDLLDCLSGGTGGGRDRRSRSNPLVHGVKPRPFGSERSRTCMQSTCARSEYTLHYVHHLADGSLDARSD